MSNTNFSAEVLRIAQLYDRDPVLVKDLMELHNVVALPLCRTPNDGFGPFISDLTGSINLEPSKTQQQFTQQCDPNFIVDRHAAGQDISMFLSRSAPLTGDYSDLPATSLHEMMNITAEARQTFESIPQDIRDRFGNNPVKFIDFIMDPSNEAEMVKLGLIKPAEVTPAAAASSPAADTTGGGEGA